MDQLLERVDEINTTVNNFVWGPVMLALLVGTGIYFTCRTKFFQLSHIGLWLKGTIGTLSRRKKAGDGAITPFQALSTALASTIGVGNIAGVATAIVTGGPGAIFWMWISAFFGMMTKYSEVLLAVHFRERNRDGKWVGGPMYYMQKGLNAKWLAVLFSLFCILASFGIGNLSQSNTIASSLYTSFQIPTWISGICVALIVGLVIIGGAKRIAGFAEKVVPFMGLAYLALSIIVMILNIKQIPAAFAEIFSNAFGLKAAGGGIAGYTIMQAMKNGIARGVFSNEAGLGSAPIIHAAADTDKPVKQALWGIFEVFVDTLLVCTMTALTIVMSGLWTPENNLKGVDLSMAAFDAALPGAGTYFIPIAVLFFATTTIIGWSYYGERAIEFLFGSKASLGYRVFFIAIIVFGATMNLEFVWNISDTFNGLMSIPNLIAILGLSSIVVKQTKEHLNSVNNLKKY